MRAILSLLLCLAIALPAITGKDAQAADIEAAFSQRGQSLELILSTISSATESLLVAACTFTSKPIAEALLAAHERGVQVRVVADKRSSADRNTALNFLANRGVSVRLNGKYAIHNHKFMVIDGRHVQTGSFNYTNAAVSKNAENVLVVRNNPELAGQYAKEWQQHWDEGESIKRISLKRLRQE